MRMKLIHHGREELEGGNQWNEKETNEKISKICQKIYQKASTMFIRGGREEFEGGKYWKKLKEVYHEIGIKNLEDIANPSACYPLNFFCIFYYFSDEGFQY